MQRSCSHKLSSHARRASLWYCLNNHCTQLLLLVSLFRLKENNTCIYHVWKIIIITPRELSQWKRGELNYYSDTFGHGKVELWTAQIAFCIWTQKYTALHCMHGRDEEIWTSGSWNNPIILALESTGASFLDVLLLRLQFWPSTMVFPSLFFWSSQFRSTTAPTRDNSSLQCLFHHTS